MTHPATDNNRLVLILGDQLDRESAALQAMDRQRDRVLMIEAREESRRIPSHKARTALFLAAMRHHASWLRQQDYQVNYIALDDACAGSFGSALRHAIAQYRPASLLLVQPGEHGVEQEIRGVCTETGTAADILEDRHFLCSREAFAAWRRGRKTLVMEHFYRHMRKQHRILIDDGRPEGGEWNFDRKNRASFGRQGPGMLPPPQLFAPDDITRAVFDTVQRHFPDNPGSLQRFNWPVTREQAVAMLQDFVVQRLPAFGPYQDAMWQDEYLLYHSGISAALNLKLLNPREVIEAAVQAYRGGQAPIQSVEGFVRQILGWREYVRGIYWSEMPGYLERNALDAQQPLPGFYWHGNTDMQCLRQVITQTLDTGYAHHIQRLMVTGLFALLLGVRPQETHTWYLGMYIDAVEWVEAPNTLGMSQHADGGLLGSKPYAASGRYIQRMSNYCQGCRYDPAESVGSSACPFTTLYWDFLIQHEERFTRHPRAGMQWRTLGKLSPDKKRAIRAQGASLRKQLAQPD